MTKNHQVSTRVLGYLSLILLTTVPLTAQPAFVAATWGDTSVHLLDDNLDSIGSFTVGAPNPNGIATDGSLIYVGFFSTQEVIAYDPAGVEQLRWSGNLSGLMGMAWVDGELAIGRGAAVDFFDPSTGTPIRSIPLPASCGLEGLAFDGAILWALCPELRGLDPVDGSPLVTLPNAADGCDFDGTGLSTGDPGELISACSNGDWFRVSDVDGSVIDSGSNGLDMFGLKRFEERPPLVVIPTLSHFGFALLAGMLCFFAVFLMRSRLTRWR